jgi:hypothetical protein
LPPIGQNQEQWKNLWRWKGMTYSETRVVVPRGKPAGRLFHQEKAALNTAGKGTFTLVSL